jgi:nicotinic acid mononucleotide adenylyltransferase
VYPGSFNPPTIAHLEIAEAAAAQFDLVRVDLAVSKVSLAKEDVLVPRIEDRMHVLERVAATRLWLGVVLTEAQLIADIAEGYDLVIMGADKWAQIHEPHWYTDADHQAATLARLPDIAVADRPPVGLPHGFPADRAIHPSIDITRVSSTAARTGSHNWRATEADDFDRETGAWSDTARYERWLAERQRR